MLTIIYILDKKMTISVALPDGKIILVHVGSTECVGDIKTKILEKGCIDGTLNYLQYEGRRLRENCTLIECNVQEHAALRLVSLVGGKTYLVNSACICSYKLLGLRLLCLKFTYYSFENFPNFLLLFFSIIPK